MDTQLSFFFTAPANIPEAFPYGLPASSPVTVQPTPSPTRVRAAERLSASFPTLTCIGFTEWELESLGTALRLPPPPDKPLHMTKEEYAALMQALSGAPLSPEDLPDSFPGTHLESIWVTLPCEQVHRVPGEFVQRLRAESSSDALAERWVQAIRARGPSRVAHYFHDAETAERVRTRLQHWQNIARELVAFAALPACEGHELYVSIWYDC